MNTNYKYALIALAGIAVAPVRAQETVARLNPPVAHEVRQAVEADLTTRAKVGIEQYLKAYTAGDAEALASTLTNDATFEYAADVPGVYRTIDANLLIQGARAYAAATGGVVQPVSNLEVYPTPKENTVFAHYDIGAGTPAYERHIVFVEMKGDRIAMIRDFVSVR